MPIAYRFWSPEDDAMLRMMWPTPMPVHEIAAVLERSETSITQRAYGMGLKRPVKRPHRPKDWTRKEDDALLAARHARVPYRDIRIGDRTPYQMKNRFGYIMREQQK